MVACCLQKKIKEGRMGCTTAAREKMGTTLNPPTTPSVFNGLIFEVVESNSFEQIVLLTCWQAAQNYFAVSKGCTKKF